MTTHRGAPVPTTHGFADDANSNDGLDRRMFGADAVEHSNVRITY
jgi:hypothetical protein